MATEQVTLPDLPQQDGVEFRHVPNHPGYCAGSDGSVWTLWIKVYKGKGKGSARVLGNTWKRLAGKPDAHGYPRVHIGPKKSIKVHVLILTAFSGPCPHGMECCHNDGSRSNNAISNLRWDTKKANSADRLKHGTDNRGERNYSAKITSEDVREIRQRYALLKVGNTKAPRRSVMLLSQEYGITKEAIWFILSRRTWKHIE